MMLKSFIKKQTIPEVLVASTPAGFLAKSNDSLELSKGSYSPYFIY